MSQVSPTAPPAAAGASFFVYGVLAALLATSLAVVWNYGHNVPWAECWEFMPVLTGATPLTAGWLWEQMYEHRFPLTRALMVGLFHVSGGDLRAAMYFNVLAMAASALALVRLARRLRGWQSYADAFFPLALLHLALAQNALWHGNITLTAPAALTFGILAIVLRADTHLSLAEAVLLGFALVLLPMCGGWGFLVVPPMLLWVAYTGWFVWRRTSRRNTLVLAGFAAAAAANLAVYFRGYEHPDYVQTSASLGLTMDVMLQFLSNGFGPVLRHLWPFAGYAVAALFLATLAVLTVPLWRGGHRERSRALGLLFVIGAVALLALATGYRRALSFESAGFQGRYMWTAVPWLCCAYFAWELFAAPAIRQAVQMALFMTGCLVFGGQTREAVQEALQFHEEPARLEALLEEGAARGGIPLSVVMKVHADPYYKVLKPDPMIEALRALRAAKVGAFRHLRDDTPYRDIPLDPATAVPENMAALDGKWRGAGADAGLTFAFAAPKRVAALRLMFEGVTEGGEDLNFRVSWWKDGVTDEREVQGLNTASGTGTAMVAWVCDTIDGFTLHPHEGPCTFTLVQATVQQPRPEKPAGTRVKK